MTKEEQKLFQKLTFVHAERQYLLKIYEELDKLVQSGYSGKFKGPRIENILSSIKHYKHWASSWDSNKENN